MDLKPAKSYSSSRSACRQGTRAVLYRVESNRVFYLVDILENDEGLSQRSFEEYYLSSRSVKELIVYN
ncbi:hypothetical protein Tcan_05488 [Toxocara canis]|uniref:Uncharacterized protein n=1 Tax=Toxocara canis TaxID=6265 RepID=A0A0B2VHE1_TOXCA|nr:hypothetical protein Tcan_05488 [Toxocara canis]